MPETILVVDDEPMNCDLLEAILTDAGYGVRTALDGLAALAAIAEAPPDLILLDLMMPGLSGLEVCRRLRAAPGTAGIPIIVVTALGQTATKEELLMGGADDFVVKPFRPEDVRARVTAMLSVRGIRPDLDRTLAYLHALEGTRTAQRQRPLSAPPVETQPAPAATPILLVDDDALVRELYGRLLGDHGFRVVVASSGPEGLACAAGERMEAVVLDIVMPGMSGLEVLERLRTTDPDLPVIILTGHPTSQAAITALKLGAFDFIVKGQEQSLVLLAIHRAVRFRRERLLAQEEIQRLQARVAELEQGGPTGR